MEPNNSAQAVIAARNNKVTQRHPASRMVDRLGTFLASALALYMLPFMLVLIDEAVLKTGWCAKYSSDWVADVFRSVYYPFIVILNT
jgi:hypothetical protein